MIIGVTGNYGSGKDAVANILAKMNFRHVSFSDIIRDDMKLQKVKHTRDNMIQYGNDLREKHGASILANKALQAVEDGENFVFTSIRNPFEVEHLQQRKDFILINVVAPDKVRLQRIIKRHREGDPQSINELRKKEKIENGSDPKSQQLDKVAQMAKVVIKNDSTMEILQSKVERLVTDWLFKLQDIRPDWDQYFMNIAEQVKLRCNCLSAKKGAIIVKDKMILAAGYNGTPKHITNCMDGGCGRCTNRHLGKIKSGVYSEPCLCAHSEENAIVQVAYNGTSTKDSIMYTTFTPCTNCAKMIINAGIKEVVAKVVYPDDNGTKLLKEAGVKLRVLS